MGRASSFRPATLPAGVFSGDNVVNVAVVQGVGPTQNESVEVGVGTPLVVNPSCAWAGEQTLVCTPQGGDDPGVCCR